MKGKVTGERADFLKKVRRVVVKIGSSLISSKRHGLDEKRLAAYASEAARLRKSGREIVLVSSGAIVSGLEKLGVRDRPKGLREKQAAAAVGQCRLMWAYEKSFDARGLKVGQVLLTQEDLRDRKRFLNSRNTLSTLLELGVIPIINENDTVAVEEIQFGDNDHLAASVAHLVDADLLIILSDVEGLYTENPRRNPEARLISTIAEITPEIEARAETTAGEEGVGGMASKILAAKKVAALGVPTVIASGREPRVLSRILQGDSIGTIVLPRDQRLNSRKHWIAHTLPSKGRLVLDDGAVEAIVRRGKSLLPAGIRGVEGRFEAGDAVTCADRTGREVAKGLINYASPEMTRIQGAHTADLQKILGRKDYDEAIHRDNLVIL
jgi:glutamate 5-kinase